MKSVFDTLENRRTIRQFKCDSPSDDLISKILQVATRSPSTGNMQNYSIILTRDLHRRTTLYSMHFQQEQIETAPIILTFCADVSRFTQWCKLQDRNIELNNLWGFLTAVGDSFIVAQSITLAAESAGLGTSYLGASLSNIANFIEFFELPKGVFPTVSLALGYPDECPAQPKRLSLESILHEETYSNCSPEKLNKDFSKKEREEIARYKKRGLQNEKIDSLADIYSRMKYPPVNIRAFSKNLFTKLKSQNFI